MQTKLDEIEMLKRRIAVLEQEIKDEKNKDLIGKYIVISEEASKVYMKIEDASNGLIRGNSISIFDDNTIETTKNDRYNLELYTYTFISKQEFLEEGFLAVERALKDVQCKIKERSEIKNESMAIFESTRSL